MGKSIRAMEVHERLNADPVIDLTLKACPFCGSPAQIEFWHGGAPTKRMVSCSGDDCEVRPMVTGETKRSAISKWERRTP